MRRELIHRLIEARAAANPQVVAIEELEPWRAWTIGELNRFSNIVARNLGGFRKAVIPVCLDRSAYLVIALLAILKTGSAYVIIDPEHPQERLRLILEDIRAPFVISSTKLAGRFEIPVKNIATLLSTPAPDHNINVAVDGRDVAYLVYTSGSSGRPKGVQLTHSAATTGILAAAPSSDRTIWATIINANVLCLASKESLISDLAGVISKLRVNTVGLTTTTASLLTPEDAPTLKTVVLTGERVTDAVVERWAGAVDLRSGYGLSECTQLNWSKSLSKNAPANKIDRPLDSTSAFILVPETTIISPLLVPGELCLAASSSPTHSDGGRLYPHGRQSRLPSRLFIELLGRIDRQVKVAGQRVDPEEVESVLLQHASVKTAAVEQVALSGFTTLIACVVFEGDVDESLVPHTQERLPPFALPSYWLQFEALPATATGKVAHSVLRAQLSLLSREDLLSQSFISSCVQAAVTPEELALSAECAKVLSISRFLVSMNASFMALGGTSLQAIQLCTLLRKKGWVIGVSDIIQSQTLGELAARLVAADVAIIDADAIDLAFFEDVYPASALQEGLIGSTLAGNKDYLYQRVYDVAGKDLPRLRSALEQVFRHDATLRTTFFPSGPSIVQAVLPTATPLPWAEVPESTSLDEFKKQDLDAGVHLGSPFWRVAFLPASQILVISAHHALFDFWSNSPPYTTFIRHLQTINRDESKAFWKEYLQNAGPAHLNVMEPATGSIVVRSLPNISPELQKAHGITLGTLIYSAWALVLRIHNTSPADVTFATTLAARDLPVANLDIMNGPTLTTVPQRVHFPEIESLTTLELVKTVQANLWAMMAHAQYGMRDALQLAEAKTALFNTMVNIVTKSKQDANTVFTPYGPPARLAQRVKLVSAMGVREAEFVMEQFVNAFAAVSAPEPAKIVDLRLLSAAELELLESRAEYEPATDAVIHSGMEAIALATPERPALEWEDGTVVSYGELNAKADRLAAALIERGVGPDVLVPLCVDKSIEMIIAIYGILKAGGAYVPLDPENPAERNQFICKDVKAIVGVTVPQHAHLFDEQLPLIILDGVARKSVIVRGEHEEVQVSRTLLLFESKGNEATGNPDGRKWRLITGSRSPYPTGVPPPAPTSANLAYAIYTSGSTGAPKGVLINHYCISTFITGRKRAEGYQPSWRTLLFANYVFDVSVSDIFVALSVGAVLCLASMESLMTNLYACIESFNANQISLTPTVARLLPAVPPSLTHMVLGGEPCSAELVATFAPHLTLFNSYGPTETTVYTTWGDMPPGKSPRIIGFPMYGVGSMILQPGTMDVVPYGAIGELCHLGPYVARGYLNRPESNAKSFIKWTNGERMYRTGDLIRWEASGELGSVVVLTVAGKPQLGAFMLMQPEVEEERDLRLDEDSIILPPTAFADEIATLRATLGTSSLPTWKIDAALLTRLAHALPDINQYGDVGPAVGPYVECSTPTEFALRDLWADILQIQVEDIGATSSFFHFGGDSITAISLVGKCRSRGVGALSVGDVLANPILKDMAAKVKELSAGGAPAAAQVYQPVNAVYDLAGVGRTTWRRFFPPARARSSFLEFGGRPEKFWLLQTTRELPSEVDIQRWIEVTTELTRRNPILRTTFVKDGTGKWLQVVLKSTAPRIREVEVADEDAMKAVVAEEWETDFEKGEPWVRYRLVKLVDGRRFILHRVSHAVYDGTSLRILDAQFTAIARGEPVPTVPAFNAFIHYTETLDREQRLSFWRKTLEGSTFSYPSSPSIASPACNTIHLVHYDSSIDACGPKHNVTIPVVFQTAFSLLLARLSGGTDISYDSLVTGRDLPVEDAQEMSGACATFLPFRAQFGADTALGALLKSTQAIFWETNEHGDIPILDIMPAAPNRCLFLFQPFEPTKATVAADPMRWCVLGMSKVRQEMNYALMMEVFRTPTGYVVRLRHDNRFYGKAEIEAVGEQLRAILDLMVASEGSTEVAKLI
ncbi:tyrocidine synthetase 1 [Mycena olivaceomarginata]|nr:tyrocidine synthetase 1 [Mycena olivaceomarginata]